jgi:hypothetical protein
MNEQIRQNIKKDILASVKLKGVAPDPQVQPFYDFLFSVLISDKFWESVDHALEGALADIDSRLKTYSMARFQGGSQIGSFARLEVADRSSFLQSSNSKPISTFQNKTPVKTTPVKVPPKTLQKTSIRPKTPIFSKISSVTQPLSSRRENPNPFTLDRKQTNPQTINKAQKNSKCLPAVNKFIPRDYESYLRNKEMFQTKTIAESSQLQSMSSSFSSFLDQEIRDLAYSGIRNTATPPDFFQRKNTVPCNAQIFKKFDQNLDGNNFKTINKSFNAFDSKYDQLKDRFTQIVQPVISNDSQNTHEGFAKPRSNTLQYSSSLPCSFTKERDLSPLVKPIQEKTDQLDIKGLFNKWKKRASPELVEEGRSNVPSRESAASPNPYTFPVIENSISRSNESDESSEPRDLGTMGIANQSLKNSVNLVKENTRYKSFMENEKGTALVRGNSTEHSDNFDYQREVKILSLRDAAVDMGTEPHANRHRLDRRESVKDNFERRDSLLKKSGLLFTFERKSNPNPTEALRAAESFVRKIHKFED